MSVWFEMMESLSLTDGGLQYQRVLPFKAEQSNARVLVSLFTQDLHVGRWMRNVGDSHKNQFCTSTHNNDIGLKKAFAESEVCCCQAFELMICFITEVYLCILRTECLYIHSITHWLKLHVLNAIYTFKINTFVHFHYFAGSEIHLSVKCDDRSSLLKSHTSLNAVFDCI